MTAKSFGTWESAVAWLLQQPQYEDFCGHCYYDRPATAAAERFWRSDEWKALGRYLPQPPGRALDVGAGMGVASYALARDGWRTTALEPDPSALVGAQAIRNLAAGSGLNIEVVQEWGESLPFADASFELVHARQVLHHARELPQFCRELARVTKPGGLVVATREHVVSSSAQLPAFLAKHPLHHLYGGENAFTRGTYRRALQQAGLELLHDLGPLQSVINYAPHTPASLVAEMQRRAARVPGLAALVGLLFAQPWRQAALAALSRVDRRAGRLHSFVARKPGGPAP